MPTVLDVVLVLMIIQGAIGAFDVFYNHEWEARLPSLPSAALELRIHSVRAILYAFVFGGVAWFNWLGMFAWLFVAVLAVEIALTLWDFVVEDQTRRLSALERIVHTVLAMNGGAYVGMLIYEMYLNWLPAQTSLQFVSRGWISIVLSAYAIGVLVSGIRDGRASARLAVA